MADTKRFFRALGTFSSVIGIALLVFGVAMAMVYGISVIPPKIGGIIVMLAFFAFLLVMAIIAVRGIIGLWKFSWDEAYRR